MTEPTRINALPLDWLIASGGEVTEASIAALQQVQKYPYRERIPEHLLKYTDLYNELTKQEPTRKNLSDWIDTSEVWYNERLDDEHIRAAWQQANSDKNGFTVGRMGALTVTARGAKSRRVGKPSVSINNKLIEETKQAAAEKWEQKFVPRPDYIQKPILKGHAK